MKELRSNSEYNEETYKDIKFPKELIDTNFRKCTFDKVDFSNFDLSNIYFENCKFINCDFSNSIFSKFVHRNNTYKNSKLIGIDLAKSHLDNVKFEDSQMSYSNFYESKLNVVSFIKCDLKETTFSYLEKRNKLTFEDCNLEGIEFFNTSLKDIDLRTCNINGIKVDINNLKGLIVTSYQAMYLANILGIKIKEIGEE